MQENENEDKDKDKEFEKLRMISVDSNKILERVSVDSRTNIGEEGTVMVQAVNLQLDFVNGDTIRFRFSSPDTLQNGFYDCLSEAEFMLNSN